jgi:transcription antitermination factor NusG
MTGATEMREEDRLDMMLQRKANEGVQICVLIWNETKVAVNLNSQHSQQYLENLHPSIKIIRHPLVAPVKWSHHQKILVVDQDYAVRSTPFSAYVRACVRAWTHVRVWCAVAVRNAVRGRIGLGDGTVGRPIPSHHRLAAALQVARQGMSHTRRSRWWTIT